MRDRGVRESMCVGAGIRKTELGGLGHCGSIHEVRFPEETLVSFVSLVLARLADAHNA